MEADLQQSEVKVCVFSWWSTGRCVQGLQLQNQFYESRNMNNTKTCQTFHSFSFYGQVKMKDVFLRIKYLEIPVTEVTVFNN